MRRFGLILCALLLAPMIVAPINCSIGDQPETVIVPVGEPGSGDPYASDPCASDTGAAQSIADPDGNVLVTFVGTTDTWAILLSYSEYQSLKSKLENVWGEDALAVVDHSDIDELHRQLCLSADGRSEDGAALVGILKDVLADRYNGVREGVCR